MFDTASDGLQISNSVLPELTNRDGCEGKRAPLEAFGRDIISPFVREPRLFICNESSPLHAFFL